MPSPRAAGDQIFLFGDQTAEFATSLANVATIAKKSSLLVQKFLSDAEDVFAIECRKLVGDAELSGDDRPNRETFANLLACPKEYEKLSDRTGIYQTVLSCVARLGELMLRVEQDSSILKPESTTTIRALGLCTGLLPAVVLSAAQDVQDLVHLAGLMVGVAFRLRAELHRRSRRVENTDGTWGYLVVGLRVDEIEAALDSFHEAHQVPQHHRAYVAVAAETWSAVFGPPSTMQTLLRRDGSSMATRASVTELYRANGSVHAPHLPEVDMEAIMGEFGSNVALASRPLSPAVHITSTSSCQVFAQANLAGLLQRALHDILTLRLDHDGTVAAVAAQLPERARARLVVIGGASSLSTVQKALQARDVDTTIAEGFANWTSLPVRRSGSGRVAIVGVAGRFPGSESVDAFWTSLLEGKEQHRIVPASRFGLDAWRHALGPDAPLPYGCFLERPGQFDARLFAISPREAAQMDPIHRLTLLAAWDALEAAGYSPSREDRRRVGAVVAQSSDDWRDVERQHGIDNYYVPSIARAFGSGRLHYFFKWEAPAFNVDAACGSSAVAITLACERLMSRQCDMAVAAGGMLACSPDAYAGLAKGGFLSPTGGCKVFRSDVDGYCRGESVSAVVLKRLEDAQMDNDNILAVIDGFARNHSAHASSITHPHQKSQERVFKQALIAAGAEAREIGYAELHGTGTTAGDKCEVGAVTSVLADPQRDSPLVLGAVKANIGHGEAGACLAALIKATMVLKNNGTIPPQPGFNNTVNPPQLNPEFPSLRNLNIHVADGRRHLSPGQKVLLNCFDATGGNMCMVLSPPPPRQPATQDGDGRTRHVVVCSGHTFTVMKRNERRLLDYVMTHKDECPSHLAYTTTARRIKHHQYRTAWVVENMKDLGKQLLRDQSNTEETVKKRGAVAFTFTGQGSVYRAMAKPLLKSSPRFRDIIKACQNVCDTNSFPSIIDYINGFEPEPQTKTTQEQLSLTAVQIGLVHLLRSWNLKPDVVLGHSLGEYAALYTAGVLSLSDTLYLVGRRAMLVGESCEANEHAMLMLPMSSNEAQALLDKSRLVDCSVACKNTPKATVVSGPAVDLDKLQKDLKEGRGVEATRLPVQYGFHSRQMEPVASGLKKMAQQANFQTPYVAFASTLKGKVVTTSDGVNNHSNIFGPEYLARQTLDPVEFVAAAQDAQTQGLVDDRTIWIEVGPDQVNTSMLRQVLEVREIDRLLPALKANQDCWATLGHLVASAYLRGHDIDWNTYHIDYEASNALRMVDLPGYAFELTDHWWPYVHPQAQAAQTQVPQGVEQPDGITLPHLKCIAPFLQYLAQESIGSNGTITAEFLSKVNHPEMMAAAAGHLVDGTPIYPGSGFCEMAYSAAEYLVPRHQNLPGKPKISSLILGRLEMHRPLIIATSTDDSIVRTRATCDSRGVDVEFFHEVGPDDVTPLGSVVIRFERSPGLWAKIGPTASFLVRTRCEALMQSVKTGEGHSLRRSLLYQLFQRYIGYDPGFQGIVECFLSASLTEAACLIRLPSSPSATGDRDAFNMYWRDCVFHLAGYMLNGHPDGPVDKASIAVAVEEILFEHDLNDTDTYTVYTHMAPTDAGHIGDVYVFQGQQLIALCSNMVYQTVTPRRAKMGKPELSSPIQDKTRPKTSVQPRVKFQPEPRPLAESEARALFHAPAQPQPPIPPSAPAGSNDSTKIIRGPVVDQKEDVAELILKLVAEETGWTVDSLDDDTAVADIGIDSLMNIVLVSKLRSEKGIDISPAKFRQCVTIADIRKAFGSARCPKSQSPRKEAKVVEIQVSETAQDQTRSDSGTDEATDSDNNSPYLDVFTPYTDTQSRSTTPPSPSGHPADAAPPGAECTTNKAAVDIPDAPKDAVVEVFIIQGEPRPDQPALFLVPDGSGSIASFLQLPNLAHDICVYGLHSPWVGDPAGFTCTIEQAARLYVAAVRARQPRGPYLLGGWSSGCVFAYEAARALAEDHGAEVLGLVVVDMHRPRPLPAWVETTRELWEYWCEATGLGGVFAPLPDAEDLERHLISNFRALNRYDPKPMRPGKTPKHGTLVVWAKKGMGNGLKREDCPDLPDPLGIGAWFCFDRTDFGPNGWEELVGDKIETVAIDGHHRSIMVPPDAYQLVKVIDQALTRFLA